jgi:Ca2+-transporting ATPase
MTGDGVNDAPALRQADIGIVVSEGSDVAKETADMVLLDDNFSTILAAVEEGRGIFANLRRVILYLMADAFSAIIIVATAIFLGWPLPLTAVQILWINLISDGFPDLALTVEPKDKDLLKREPIPRQTPIMDRDIILLITVISATAGLIGLALFYYFNQVLKTDLTYTRSVVFLSQGIITLAYVYSVRALTAGIWQVNPFKNLWLLLATAAGLTLQLSAVYWPPLMLILDTQAVRLEHWYLILAAVALLLVIVEVVKLILRSVRLVNHGAASTSN